MKINKMLSCTTAMILLFIPFMGFSATIDKNAGQSSATLTNTYSFLNGGLNINDANRCQTALKTCINPKDGPMPNDICVNKTVKTKVDCAQLKQLAAKLDTSPAFLSATEAPNHFAVVAKHYPADGQIQNYIVTPTGLVVDTLMDPRIYSSVIKMQYPNNDLLVTNVSDIQAKKALDNKTLFITTLQINDSCKACTVLGYATVRFVFNKAGNLSAVRLMSFNKNLNHT